MNYFIKELKSKIENGIHWEIAIIDCISEWNINEEFYRGYKYKYWINNEAFDWMTLTERLGSAIKSYLNKEKYQELIFTGLLSIMITSYFFSQNSFTGGLNLSFI